MKNLRVFENSQIDGTLQRFNGVIRCATIESKKLEEEKTIRTVTIADLHGYTNDKDKARRLAEAIISTNPDFIFIAGDIFNGGLPWEGGKKLERFKDFISILSEVAPVFITWGNHDLRKMTSSNKELRIKNFRSLKSIRKGKVYPLYNDSVIVDGMEIVGYVPSFELMEGDKLEGLSTQIHGIAHDKFIKEYEEHGTKFEHPELVTIYLGHDPHLIAASENGIGLGSLSKCDFFITGHLHDGYKPILETIGLGSIESLEHDCGWVEQPTLVDKNGERVKKPIWPIFYGKTNLCRGIVFFDDDAQQKIWVSPDGDYYKNIATEDNEQEWVPIGTIEAKKEIIERELHYMLISEGIAPGFAPSEELATINVVDIKGTQKVLKR